MSFTKKIINILAGYVRQSDGFFGMYRGLTPKLAGFLVSMVFSEKIADKIGLQQLDLDENELLDDEQL